MSGPRSPDWADHSEDPAPDTMDAMGTCPGPLKQTAGADSHNPVFRYRARPALVVCVNWVCWLCSWFVPPLADLYRCCPAWGLPAFGSAPNNPQPRQHRSVWVGAVHDFVYTDNPQQASACMSVRPGRRCGAVTGWAHGVPRWRCQPLPGWLRCGQCCWCRSPGKGRHPIGQRNLRWSRWQAPAHLPKSPPWTGSFHWSGSQK